MVSFNLFPKMNKDNTALILIDIVNAVTHENCEEFKITFSKIRAMIPKLRDFLVAYREKVGGKVIFINITPWTKDYLPSNINQLYEVNPVSYYYSNDTSGFPEKFYGVEPMEKDIIITKNTYDAFANPKMKEVLEEDGIEYLITTGIFSDGCVMATICGGFQAGFNFVILKDLIETTDEGNRQKLGQLLKEITWPTQYGLTLNSAEFLKMWEKQTTKSS